MVGTLQFYSSPSEWCPDNSLVAGISAGMFRTCRKPPASSCLSNKTMAIRFYRQLVLFGPWGPFFDLTHSTPWPVLVGSQVVPWILRQSNLCDQCLNLHQARIGQARTGACDRIWSLDQTICLVRTKGISSHTSFYWWLTFSPFYVNFLSIYYFDIVVFPVCSLLTRIFLSCYSFLLV